jgi:imidazolonepropionase-like amidohydrolase
MRITTAILLTVLFSGMVSGSTVHHGGILIRNVSIVDVRTGVIDRNRDVRISGDRIETIGKNLKPVKEAVIVDGTGKFLIPGLWDMHVHALRNDRSDPFFKLFIANGVTGVRDMGTTADAFAGLSQLRADIAVGKILGPRIVAAGRILDGAKPDVPPNSIPFTGEAEAREVVRLLKRSGADFIKVYNGVSRAEYFAIIDEAKKLNIPVAGHIPFEVTSAEASNAGQRSFEHLGNILRSCSSLDREVIEQRANAEAKSSGKPNDFSAIPARIAARTRIELETFDERKCGELFALFVKNRTWQVPTLATKRPLSLIDEGGFESDPRMKYIPAKELENWKPENNFLLKFRTPEFKVQKKRLYQKELELVRDMHRSGVPFMTGTDIPGAYTYPGFTLHDELELFVENGFTPLEALRAATLNPAIYLALENELGTIEKGKLADLVLLDVNPLENIRNTKRIYAVVVNGRLFDRAKLNELLSGVQQAAETN